MTSSSGSSSRDAPARSWAPLALALLAAIAHLVVGFFYLASGLLAPLWAVVLLLVCWVLLAYWLVRLAVARSWWTPAPPAVAVAWWFVVITAGERLLGWTP